MFEGVQGLGNFLTGETVYHAWKKLEPFVHRTPLLTSSTTNQMVGKNVYFKMENQQKTGAFKFRGATFKLMQLPKEQLQNGVVTASAGNHAQGVAYAGAKLGVHTTIFMAEGTPIAKINATKAYGAEVVLVGESFQEAYEASLERKAETGAAYIHPFDDYDVMAGQGTVAMEMLRQEDRIDTVLVPIGGGGLISGIATAVKSINRNIRVIGVQAEAAAAMHGSFHRNVTEKLKSVQTIAEGIAVKQPGKYTLPVIRKYVDDIVTVCDEEIASAIIYMLERNKTLMEGAGAASLAALFKYHDRIPSRNCGLIVSGGNLDIGMLPMIQKLASKQKTFAS